MINRRLHLWRLANFDVTRVPTVEDVYLYHCVGRENPSDERLDRLEAKRYLTSHMSEPLPERGGRSRRYYGVTPAGRDDRPGDERIGRLR